MRYRTVFAHTTSHAVAGRAPRWAGKSSLTSSKIIIVGIRIIYYLDTFSRQFTTISSYAARSGPHTPDPDLRKRNYGDGTAQGLGVPKD